MVLRIARVLRFEWEKAIRRPVVWGGLGAVALVSAAAVLAEPPTAEVPLGYRYIARATGLALDALGILIVLLLAAESVAGEQATGTWQATLLRPVSRMEAVVGKLLFAMTYAAGLVLIVAVVVWGVVMVWGTTRGVSFGGELLYARGEMLRAYGLGMALVLTPLWAAAAFGLLCSTVSRNASSAITLAAVLWMISELLKYPLGAADGLFTTYAHTPWRVFASYSEGFHASWQPEAGMCVFVCGLWFFGSAGVSAVLVHLRSYSR